MSEFKQYRRTNIAEMRPYVEGEELSGRVSISAADLEAGSPKVGDMIARNPANHEDQWLVAQDYFEANFEELGKVFHSKAEYLKHYFPKEYAEQEALREAAGGEETTV